MQVCKAELQLYFSLHHLMSAKNPDLLPLRFDILRFSVHLRVVISLEIIIHPILPCWT